MDTIKITLQNEEGYSQTYLEINNEIVQSHTDPLSFLFYWKESIIRKFVRTRCNPYLKGNQNLGSQERADLLKEVKSVLTSLSNVESKQKTYSSLASAKRKVEDLINKLGDN